MSPLVAPLASRTDQLAYAQREGATDAVSFPSPGRFLRPLRTKALRCFPSTVANADGCPPAPSIGCMPRRAPVASMARTPGPCPGTLGVAPKSTSRYRRFQLHHPSAPPPSLLFLPSSLPRGWPRRRRLAVPLSSPTTRPRRRRGVQPRPRRTASVAHRPRHPGARQPRRQQESSTPRTASPAASSPTSAAEPKIHALRSRRASAFSTSTTSSSSTGIAELRQRLLPPSATPPEPRRSKP